MQPLLNVDDLTISFGGLDVVRGISFSLQRGRVLALVGESGSGKSMTAHAIMRLVPRPGRITSGKITFCGKELLALPEHSMRQMRGKDISMIFQEPMTSLNPVLTVGRQIMEPMEIHDGLSRSEAKARAIALLESVGIPAPAARFSDYPHQFSGGMRQRAMIAMALACSPALLLADEPTTALDITIQRQILGLIKDLAQSRDMGVLLITHDLGVVAECADDVSVMYAGQLLEQSTAEVFFREPLHPYARMLMECAPLVGNHERQRLPFIPGSVPRPGEIQEGCLFRPRCPLAQPSCREPQPMRCIGGDHMVRCSLAKNP
ncbi:MAG: ABC transporter ATP-binding protein [Mailhella sp.]|nr:ABC transporter ATP-binding protein [Mailhella sp.]